MVVNRKIEKLVGKFLLCLKPKHGGLVPASELGEHVPSETRDIILQFAQATPRND